MADAEIVVCRDLADLSHRAAEYFIDLAVEAAARSERFTVALSGGSTPKSLYSLLASPGYRERIPWHRVHLFWGDERCVPPHHPESNYRMVQESLLSKIDIPAENVHRMAGEKDPQSAAAEYEQQLKKFFQPSPGTLPRFDLILLGLGEDGHTASLFPGSDALEETEHLVATSYVERLKAHRLTLTLPVLNHAAEVMFLVVGQSKAAIVKSLIGPKPGSPDLPAARVRPYRGRLTWLITQDATGGLNFQ
jgi:6-phosphogluconolactonase